MHLGHRCGIRIEKRIIATSSLKKIRESYSKNNSLSLLPPDPTSDVNFAMACDFGEDLWYRETQCTLGVSDSVLNEYITDSFFTSSSKTVFIIDIKEPLTDLLKRENVFYIGGGVLGMDSQFILAKIGI